MRVQLGLFAFLLAMLAASPIHAVGNNLSWDACGSDGEFLRSFACGENTGADVLVGSVRPHMDLPAVVGMSAELVFVAPSTAWPDWWQFHTEGACRRASLSAAFVDPAFGNGACLDPWQGQAIGGVASYSLAGVAFGTARLHLSCAVLSSNTVPISTDEHTFLFTLRIDHQRTIGTGACAGCATPMCLMLRSVTLHQPEGVGDYSWNGPDERDHVLWQPSSFPAGCYVPTQNRTWGAIKSLYR